MKVKKLLSTFAALAIAASSFAGLGINASAEEPVTTKYTVAGQNRCTATVDEETQATTLATASNAGNQYALGIVDFSAATEGAGKITVTFDTNIASGSRWLVGLGDKATRGTNANGSSKSTYNTDGLLVRFGTSDGSTYKVNGGDNIDGALGTDVTATVVFDKENAKYSYTLAKKEDSSVLASVENVETSIADMSVLEFYSWVNSASTTISQVSVTTEAPTKTEVDYTVKYVLDDETVIKSDPQKGYAGNDAVISKEAFVQDSVKYLFVSAPEDLTITENAEYKVIVKEAAQYDMKAVASTDNNVVFAESKVFEGDEFSYTYPKYLTDENNKVTAKLTSGESVFGVKSTPNKSETIEVAYTEYTGDAWFVEAGDSVGRTGVTGFGLSSGSARKTLQDSSWTNLPYQLMTVAEDGKYKITIGDATNRTDKEMGMGIFKNDAAVEENMVAGDAVKPSTANVTKEAVTENVELKQGDVLYVKLYGSADSNAIFDYLLIEKTGELAPSIAAVATETPDGVTAPTAPAKLTALDNTEVDYASVVTDGKTVTTIYVKVDNGSDDVKPVITLSNGETMTVTKASYDGGYFICQYAGDADVTVKNVTYGDASWSAEPTE